MAVFLHILASYSYASYGIHYPFESQATIHSKGKNLHKKTWT